MILDKIIEAKKAEVTKRKELYPVKLLEQSTYFKGQPVSLTKYLSRDDLVGIIAEIKRKSPSKGAINEFVDIETVSVGYMQAGASALSVLTDTEFFGGSSEDLTVARSFNFCPILRKDFIVDEYQVVEAKSIGADVILLIAAALESKEIETLSGFAKGLGLEVLLEVHSLEELEKSPLQNVDVVGVNNRDLKTFTVDTKTSLEILPKIPSEKLKISESGIREPKDLVELKKAGFDGFLIGERFMQESRPHEACSHFISEVRELLS